MYVLRTIDRIFNMYHCLIGCSTAERVQLMSFWHLTQMDKASILISIYSYLVGIETEIWTRAFIYSNDLYIV